MYIKVGIFCYILPEKFNQQILNVFNFFLLDVLKITDLVGNNFQVFITSTIKQE